MRAAVVDDVRRLVRRQVPVGERVVDAAALQPEHDLVGPVVVGQQHRHVVTRAQAVRVQRLRQACRALLELGEGDHLSRRGDQGGAAAGVTGGVGGGAKVGRAGLGWAHHPLLADPADAATVP